MVVKNLHGLHLHILKTRFFRIGCSLLQLLYAARAGQAF